MAGFTLSKAAASVEDTNHQGGMDGQFAGSLKSFADGFVFIFSSVLPKNGQRKPRCRLCSSIPNFPYFFIIGKVRKNTYTTYTLMVLRL